jgi:KDO2-lipid IV(A) lauroyltransferase
MRPLDLAYFIYLYPLRFAARIMPPRLFMRVCQALIRLAPGIWSGSRDRVARNMRAAFPGATEDEIREWATAAVTGFLDRAAQDLVTQRLVAGGHLGEVRIAGLHHLEAARAEGRGVVVFSGHFLATRLARRCLEARGMPMLATRKGTPPRRRVGRWGHRVLQPAYERFLDEVIRDEVFVKERGSTLRILRRLREGGTVYGHADTWRAATTEQLLGVPTEVGRGLLEVVRLTRAPLVPVAWVGDWRRLTIEFFEPLVLTDTPDRKSFATANMPRIIAKLEALIRRHPDQWEYWVLGWPDALEHHVLGRP